MKNNLTSKVFAVMISAGAILGPVMPSVSMAMAPKWAMDGVANGKHEYFGKSVYRGLSVVEMEEFHKEKGSPLRWKAQQTFFGMVIDHSPEHWGNNVLRAEVNQLYIPSSHLTWYASNPKVYKDQINQIVAEANGFNTKEEMKSWIIANLDGQYKDDLMANVLKQVGDNNDVAEVAMVAENVVSQGVADATTTTVDMDLTPEVEVEIANPLADVRVYASDYNNLMGVFTAAGFDDALSYKAAKGVVSLVREEGRFGTSTATEVVASAASAVLGNTLSSQSNYHGNVFTQTVDLGSLSVTEASDLALSVAVQVGDIVGLTTDHAQSVAFSVDGVTATTPGEVMGALTDALDTHNTAGVEALVQSYLDEAPVITAAQTEALVTLLGEFEGEFDELSETAAFSELNTFVHAVETAVYNGLELGDGVVKADGRIINAPYFSAQDRVAAATSVVNALAEAPTNVTALDVASSVAANIADNAFIKATIDGVYTKVNFSGTAVDIANVAASIGVASGIAAGLDLSSFDLAVSAVDTIANAMVEASVAKGASNGINQGVARDAAAEAVADQSDFTKRELLDGVQSN